MQIYLMINPNFLLNSSSKNDFRSWVEEYANQLRLKNNSVELFAPFESKLKKNSIVHLFSSFDAETWFVLKDMGHEVIITPWWHSHEKENIKTELHNFFILKIFRIIRGIAQRKYPPIDECFFRKSAKHYFVFTQEQNKLLNRKWDLSEESITQIDLNPSKAAEQVMGVLSKSSI